MHTIKAKELTTEGFEKYGVFQNLLDNESMAKKSIFPSNFFADLITFDFASTTLPSVSICHVKKQEKNVVSFLEAHQYTCEGLLPLDGDIIIFVGTPTKKFTVDSLEAFIVPKGTFIKLNPLIVHGTQYPMNNEEVHIVCMLPARTFRNDMIPQTIVNEDEMAEIIL
jgi:ureidoglycolate lyase